MNPWKEENVPRGFKSKTRERIVIEAWPTPRRPVESEAPLRWHVRLVGRERETVLGKFHHKADALSLARREAAARRISIHEHEG